MRILNKRNGTLVLSPQELKYEVVTQSQEMIEPSFPQVYQEWIHLLQQEDISISRSLTSLIHYIKEEACIWPNLGVTQKLISSIMKKMQEKYMIIYILLFRKMQKD